MKNKKYVNKGKNIKTIVNEIKSNPQKKAWIILFGYFLFFLFVVIAIRSNSSTTSVRTKKNSYMYFSVEKIKNSNYHFKHIVNFDYLETFYEGDKEDETLTFTKSFQNVSQNYQKANGIYYLNQNNSWQQVQNPFLIPSLNEISVIEKIWENSKYISKTEFEDGTRSYHYQISTTTLVKLFDFLDIDIADNPNDITVTTNTDGDVVKIEFNFTSYTNYKSLTTTLGTVSIQYSNFH